MIRSIKLIVLSLFFYFTFLHPGNCSDELTEAIKNNDVSKVKTFIEANPALIDKELPYRSYPLHEATGLLKTDIVKLLLEHGAKVNALSSSSGESPVFFLVQNREFSKDAFDRKIAILNLLVEHKANLNACSKEKKSPFYVLASFSAYNYSETLDTKLKFMELFIAKGAKPAIKLKAEKALLCEVIRSAIAEAGIASAVIKMVGFLIDKGVDINTSDMLSGDTPLIVAIRIKTDDEKVFTEAQKQELVKLLVENGADIRLRNKKGERPKSMMEKDDPLYDILTKTKKKKKGRR